MDHRTGRHESHQRETNVRSFDLQDLYRANPKAFVAAGALIGVCFVALLAKGLAGTSSGHAQLAAHTRPAATTTRTATTTAAAQSGVTTPNPNYHPSYASNVPSSPIDQRFAAAMGASGADVAATEAVNPPAPAWTTAYPEVAASSTRNDQAYATAFLIELLDRNYRTQSLGDLERWVAAETASEVVPGLPAEAAERALYAELMDPSVIGGTASPVPTGAQWSALARAGVTQRAYDLFVNPNPQWSEVQSKGFTSADPLLGIDDVTGVLATTQGRKTTTKHFSLSLVLGSALYHKGYGAAGILQWGLN
jgi:hypothetical protein